MEVLPAVSPVLAMTSGKGRNVCCSSRVPTITRSAVSTVPPTKTRPATRGRVPDRAMTSAGEHSACCSSPAPAPCYHSAGRVRSPADDAAKSSTKLPAGRAGIHIVKILCHLALGDCLHDDPNNNLRWVLSPELFSHDVFFRIYLRCRMHTACLFK
jgi:hypothetical protein